jgi:hypothetical protein
MTTTTAEGALTAGERRALIDTIRRFPDEIEALVAGLGDDELFGEFIPGEWTVAQNVHHLADTHMQHLIRLKLTLVEEQPSFWRFDQPRWAERPDAAQQPIGPSLQLLRALHPRIVAAYEGVAEDEWARLAMHPVYGPLSVDDQLKLTAGHGGKHVDQITKTLAAGRH